VRKACGRFVLFDVVIVRGVAVEQLRTLKRPCRQPVGHPDRKPDDPDALKFKAISEAYEVLSDSETKADYVCTVAFWL